jgi:hypothetical protein
MGDPKPLQSAQERFLRQYPELRPSGPGIIIRTGRYNPDNLRLPNGNAAGYVGEIPEGFKVGRLGHVSTEIDPNNYEFVFWDPSRIEVKVHRKFATSHILRLLAFENARETIASWEKDGFNVAYKSYDDVIVLLAKRPIATTASPADGTSQSTP